MPIRHELPYSRGVTGERLQKVLAGAGLGSRREIEQWIRDGRVRVGGRVARLGDRVAPDEEVHVDGRRIALRPTTGADTPAHALLLYHKPLGEVSTRHDPQRRPTIFDRLPPAPHGRWINVGRLDANTSGLLIFTTDGELAHRLMHPSAEVPREYRVRLRGHPTAQQIEQLRRGVALDDGPAAFDEILEQRGSASHGWYHVVLREGRNREVRRLWEAVGLPVSRLMRVRYGPVRLPRDLPAGGFRPASPEEIEALRTAARGPRA